MESKRPAFKTEGPTRLFCFIAISNPLISRHRARGFSCFRRASPVGQGKLTRLNRISACGRVLPWGFSGCQAVFRSISTHGFGGMLLQASLASSLVISPRNFWVRSEGPQKDSMCLTRSRNLLIDFFTGFSSPPVLGFRIGSLFGNIIIPPTAEVPVKPIERLLHTIYTKQIRGRFPDSIIRRFESCPAATRNRPNLAPRRQHRGVCNRIGNRVKNR